MRFRGVVAAIALLVGGLLAFGSTAGAADMAYGQQSLQVTVTDGGYITAPVVTAGQYQVTVENVSGQAVDLILVRVPDGWTAEGVRDSIAITNDLASTGAISQSVLRSRAIPYVISVGQAPAHGRGFSNVELQPGTWMMLSAAVEADSQFTRLTVVGEA